MPISLDEINQSTIIRGNKKQREKESTKKKNLLGKHEF